MIFIFFFIPFTLDEIQRNNFISDENMFGFGVGMQIIFVNKIDLSISVNFL